MKILILSNSAFIVHRFRKELILAIKQLNYTVYIGFPFADAINDKRSIDELKEMNCKLIDTKMSRRKITPVRDLGLIIKYMTLLREIKPDIVLTYTIKPNIYCGLACRIKKVDYIASVTGLGSAFQKDTKIQNLILFLFRHAFKNVSCVFFQNRMNLDFFKNSSSAGSNARLVPGSGVNIKEFTPLEYPNDDIIKLVSITRILKEKGIDEYLQAAKFITRKYDNVEFHICGHLEDDYKNIIKEYEDNGIVKYHGLVEDVKDILSTMHCTVLASYHEGMSNVLLESAACARPVIATDISGCREIVDDGVTGYLVKVADSQDLIEKIEKFIKLPYRDKVNMGLEGRKKVEKNFDRKRVVDAYLEEIVRTLIK